MFEQPKPPFQGGSGVIIKADFRLQGGDPEKRAKADPSEARDSLGTNMHFPLWFQILVLLLLPLLLLLLLLLPL